MELKDLVSVIAIVATTIVAVVSIFLNHRSNLKQQLFLEKLRIYKELLEVISLSTNPQSDHVELRTRLVSVKQEIILFSTEAIIQALANLGEINFTSQGQTPEQQETKQGNYLVLLNLMRSDLLKKNKEIPLTTLKNILL